jgi:anti-sigma regulatory factor (Ser/Thr protein kinase)
MKKGAEEDAQNKITQPALVDAIPTLVEFVSTHAWEAGFDNVRIREIGLAVEEALRNIIIFSCPHGTGEISIACNVHDSGTLLIDIIDTGAPFNMLLANTFLETEDFFEPGKAPSTSVMKKAIKNIEYRRGSDRNTLVFTVTPDMRGKK